MLMATHDLIAQIIARHLNQSAGIVRSELSLICATTMATTVARMVVVEKITHATAEWSHVNLSL